MVLALGIPEGGWSQTPYVEYDHYNTNANETHSIKVSQGQFFEVRISNTCGKSEVKIESFGVKAAAPSRGAGAAAPGGCLANQPRTLQIPHLPQFGGYVVRISPANPTVRFMKSNAGSNCTAAGTPADCKPLKEVMLFISTGKRGFDWELSGAFTISDLTDKVFSLREGAVDGESVMLVERDAQAEDDYRLGFAGLINVFHHRHPLFAGSFGLGINENSDVSFFIGPSWRLGGSAFLTAGWNWGPVTRLPSGTREGDPVTDANLLADLPKKTDSAFFVAVSYSFLSPGEGLFKKPFATSED